MFEPGQLVSIAGSGDGIVFDVPSQTKAVVAVVDRTRGPVFRTVNPSALTPREQEGPRDHALRLLIRRTPRPAADTARATTAGRRGAAGFTRGTAHRSTGR